MDQYSNISLPVISYQKIKDGMAAELEKLYDACSNWGIFYLQDTSISNNSVSALLERSKQFFDLSAVEKRALDFKNAKNFSGYVRFGKEQTRGHSDLKESLVIGQDSSPPQKEAIHPFYQLYGVSQYPDDSCLPGFKEDVESYLQQQQKLGQSFMEILAQSLGVSTKDSNSYCTMPLHLRSRLMNYERLSQQSGNEIRVHEHTDLALFNMLLIDKPGLEVKDFEGNWHSVLPIEGTFIVILGELVQQWSNNQFKAGIHRVKNSELKERRLSVAFFFFPNLLYKVKSIARENPEGKLVGEVLWNRINSIY